MAQVPTYKLEFPYKRSVGPVLDEPIARVEFQSLGAGGLSDDDFVLDDFSTEIAAPAPLLAPWQLALLGAGLLLLALHGRSPAALIYPSACR